MNRRYLVKHEGANVGNVSVMESGGASIIKIISIAPSHRGKGLASKLMKRVIARELKHNPVIRLECRPDKGMEKRVREWYERLGFKATGEGKWMELRKQEQS